MKSKRIKASTRKPTGSYLTEMYLSGGKAGYSKSQQGNINVIFRRMNKPLEGESREEIRDEALSNAVRMANAYNKRMQRMEKSGLHTVNPVYKRAQLDNNKTKPRVSVKALQKMSDRELESQMKQMNSILSNPGSKVSSFIKARSELKKMQQSITEASGEKKDFNALLEDMYQTDLWKIFSSTGVLYSEDMRDYINEEYEKLGKPPVQALAEYMDRYTIHYDMFADFLDDVAL